MKPLGMELTRDADRSGSVARVMMVDDDPNDHLLLTMAARQGNVPIEFSHVGDGGELMFALEERARTGDLPQMILLDLRMPGLDGEMTMRLLRRDPDLAEIPVSVFTSSTRESDHQKSLDAGARWADAKPSNIDGMVAFANELVARVRAAGGS